MTDFDVLTLLLRAKSKDFVLKVCHESLTGNDNTLSEISSVIECSDEETTSLLKSLQSLITNLIAQNLTTPTEITSVFPDSFHKNLATLLTKILVEMLPVWRAKLLENQISLPRLTSFSWSVSSAQQQSAAAVPVCYLNLSIKDRGEVKAVNAHLSKETLGALLAGLKQTKAQIDSLTS